MNIVFLTLGSTHHCYLINDVHQHFAIKKVFLQEAYAAPTPWDEKLKALLKPQKLRLSLEEKLMNALFAREKQQEARYEKELLFKGQEPYLDATIACEKVASFNHEDTVQKVKAENPDLIIVFGTPILKGEILNVAHKAILNIHRGIVPEYKGGGLPTWTLYNNDFDYLGVTIHVCTANLDAGDIVAQQSYRLEKNDHIHTLRAKTTMLAAQLLKEVIRGYAQAKVTYAKQGPGKTWRSKDLNLNKEIIARRNLKKHLQTLN